MCRIAAASIPCFHWLENFRIHGPKHFDRSVSQDPLSPLRAPRRSSMGYLWQGNGDPRPQKERAVYVPIHSAGEVRL
jgi:hypothetical protein